MRVGPLGLAVVLAGLAGGARAEHCPPIPDDQGANDSTLAAARATLMAGGTLEVLAVGTTLGEQADPLDTARDVLGRTIPRSAVSVTRIGHHGMAAAELLEALRAALPGRPYRLVIWQTGTWEAARNLNPGEFQEALQEGAALVQQSGASLVLVNPQFSRFLQANADIGAYLGAMQLVAALPEVALFRRYDLTHDWAEADEGGLDLERADKDARAAVSQQLQHCVGVALGDYILAVTARRSD